MCPAKINPHDDPRGEELLRDLDQLQASEMPPDIEPPAMIDQAVRNMARRAVSNQTPNQQRNLYSPLSGKLGWTTGLATVSMALIALGVALLQAPQTPDLAAPVLKAKKAETSLKAEKTNDAMQSVASMRSESADERTREADRSATLEMMKKAAEPMAAAPATSRTEAPATARLSEEAFADSADSLQQTNSASAQAWLELIQQLHDQGLTTEATEQLRAFVTDYPDFPLPEWALQLQQLQ